MNEKRFEFYSDDYLIGVLDNVTEKTLNHFATIDLLNEQQATNDYLEEANSRLQIQLGETLRLVDEQQATITSLKERLYDFEKRKIIEESDIDEDVIPKVKLLRAELFGEEYE